MIQLSLDIEGLIEELADEIGALQVRMRTYARKLAPFYARRDSIRNDVAYTHQFQVLRSEGRVVVVKFEAAGREARRGLFAELDRLYESTAVERNAQKELRLELDAAERKLHILQTGSKRKR